MIGVKKNHRQNETRYSQKGGSLVEDKKEKRTSESEKRRSRTQITKETIIKGVRIRSKKEKKRRRREQRKKEQEYFLEEYKRGKIPRWVNRKNGRGKNFHNGRGGVEK